MSKLYEISPAIRKTMEWRGYTAEQMVICPSCKRKTLFPKKDEVFNCVCKKTGRYICLDCGDDQNGMVREHF